jgi:Ion transport protein
MFCFCTDAEDDIKWKLTLCSASIRSYALSPMQLVIKHNSSYAASLILRVVARSWNSAVSPDAIYMPDLIDLLEAFPTLTVPFLTDQIKHIQVAEPFYLTFGNVCAAGCKSQWVRAAISLQAVSALNWNTITQEHLNYMADTYRTDLIQSIIERFLHLDEKVTAQFFYDNMDEFLHYAPGMVRDFLINAYGKRILSRPIFVQHAIPVRNCNTIELLEAAVTIAESQDSALLFKSEVIAAVTDLHWNLFGRADHIFSLLMYILLLALFTLLIVVFDTWVTTSTSLKTLAWTLQGIKCIIFTGYFIVQEYRELMYEGFAKWVWDAWNIMDITAYGLIYASVIVQACSNPEQPAHSKAANVINAIAAVLLWCKLLHYMRPYKATGVLVSMIFKILMKIRAFMVVLAVVVTGFATAFYSILSVKDSDDPLNYSYPHMAVRTSFAYMLGNYELAVLDVGPSQVMLSILWIVFSVIVSILLLNLLIAIISYNFEKLYETSEHSFMMEKTKVVLLSNIKLSDRRRDDLNRLLREMPYVVVFKPYVYTEESPDKWAGRIDTITTTVSGTVNSVQADVNSVKTDVNSVKADVNNVKACVDGVNAKVTALSQQVSHLTNIIEEILKAVRPSEQQTNATNSAPVDNDDEHNAAATPLTPSTAASATEEPILGTRTAATAVVTTSMTVSQVD